MGLFPGAFVEKMILPKKLILARVVHSFAATDTDEINISEKEVIEIMQEGEFRGSSELVLMASQLTKPLTVKRLFPSLVCFLNPSPEPPSSIDLKQENMNSILIITNLTCWLLKVR